MLRVLRRGRRLLQRSRSAVTDLIRTGRSFNDAATRRAQIALANTHSGAAVVLPDTDATIVTRLRSPAFAIPYPDLRNEDLMPADVRDACRGAWAHGAYEESDVIVRRFQNVYLTNQGLVVRADDLGIYRSSISQHTNHDLNHGLDVLRAALLRGRVNRFREPMALCFKPGHDNYGHWLNEMMPRAAILRDLGLQTMRYIVPPQSGALGRALRDSAALLGLPRRRLVPACEPMWCEDVYLVEQLTHHGIFMSPLVFDAAREVAAQVPGDPDEAIYVTRRGFTRAFAEEDAVAEAFQRAGFRVIDPAGMSFRQQVAAFKNARRIVGVMGAGLSNISFTAPGARITVFAPTTMADTFYWFLAGLNGHTYREVRCPVTGQARRHGAKDMDLDMSVDAVMAAIL
ncbi:glycosyltransferase family 61 protein [Methylobacterium planeticum]